MIMVLWHYISKVIRMRRSILKIFIVSLTSTKSLINCHKISINNSERNETTSSSFKRKWNQVLGLKIFVWRNRKKYIRTSTIESQWAQPAQETPICDCNINYVAFEQVCVRVLWGKRHPLLLHWTSIMSYCIHVLHCSIVYYLLL